MSRSGLNLSRGGSLLAMLATFVSCSPATDSLSSLKTFYAVESDATQVDVNLCTSNTTEVKSNLKYLFVIDNSSSNRMNYKLKYRTDSSGNVTASPQCPIDLGANNQYATDPTRERRYQALLSFMQAIEADPVRSVDTSRFYGMIEFSTSAAARRVAGQNFTTDVTGFKDLVSDRYTSHYVSGNGVDDGTTDYLAALNLAKAMIQADIAAAKAVTPAKSSAYVIVFISDGFPIPGAGLLCVNNDAVFLDSNGRQISGQSPSEIKQVVQSMVALESDTDYVDMVSLFTGYLKVDGNEDPGARKLLREMAEIGKGVAYEFGLNQSVDFNLFTLPPRKLTFDIGEIFVRNLNSVWWPGYSQRLVDTDADGLPDVLDVPPRFSPTQRDTNGNGLSDLVEFRSPTGISCSGIPAGDEDGDGLSNCEEVYLGNSAGRLNYDSNANLIPDGLEFITNLDFKSSQTSAQGDPDFDGLSNRTEIKLGLPPFMDNRTLLNAEPLTYEVFLASQTALRKCYLVRVKGIRRMVQEDRVVVQFIERTSSIFNQARLRTAEGHFTAGDPKLNIQLPDSP